MSEEITADSGVLVGVDLRGIQAFVFEGRRLLDAVGRSELVNALVDTERGGREGIAELFATVEPKPAVLRNTGGALVVAFRGPGAAEQARMVTACYTHMLHTNSERIVSVVVHLPYGQGEQPESLAEAARRIGPMLALKRGQGEHTPVQGYGVTAICEVTGRPAEEVDASRGREAPVVGEAPGSVTAPERVARDVLRARKRGRDWHAAKAKEWLGDPPPRVCDLPLDLPLDVEHLGREIGEVSQQAVIHLDFNGLGDLLHGYARSLADEEFTTRMREVSEQIRALAEGLAKALTGAVAGCLDEDWDARRRPRPVLRGPESDQELCAPVAEDRHGRRRVKVPIRPIVAGGDDLTILCDARLAWSVTRFALEWLDTVDALNGNDDPRRPFVRRIGKPWGRQARLNEADPEARTGVPTVKVGIAVQPVGAPLISGYRISEALSEEAKQGRLDRIEQNPGNEQIRSEHTVAWALDFDTPERVRARLTRRADATGTSLKAQPLPGTTFVGFLDDYLNPVNDGSLLGKKWRDHRSWLLGDLPELLEQGGDLEAELERRRGLGRETELPSRDRALLLEAIDLVGLHWNLNLGAQT